MRDLPIDDFLNGQTFGTDRWKPLGERVPTPTRASTAPTSKTVAPGITQSPDGRMSTDLPLPKWDDLDGAMLLADVADKLRANLLIEIDLAAANQLLKRDLVIPPEGFTITSDVRATLHQSESLLHRACVVANGVVIHVGAVDQNWNNMHERSIRDAIERFRKE